MRYIGGGHHGTCMVNGVEVQDVFECDTKLGFAIVGERDSDGRIVADGYRAKRKLVTGETTFIMKPRT